MAFTRPWTLGGMTAVALIFSATNAFAHAHLQTSTPAANATVAPPAVVTLQFTEPLEPRFSGFEIKNAKGALVKASPQPTTNAMILSAAPAAPLAPGAYNVSWHIVAHDGHRMRGAFSFIVKP